MRTLSLLALSIGLLCGSAAQATEFRLCETTKLLREGQRINLAGTIKSRFRSGNYWSMLEIGRDSCGILLEPEGGREAACGAGAAIRVTGTVSDRDLMNGYSVKDARITCR